MSAVLVLLSAPFVQFLLALTVLVLAADTAARRGRRGHVLIHQTRRPSERPIPTPPTPDRRRG